jgi:hypothetical protein
VGGGDAVSGLAPHGGASGGGGQRSSSPAQLGVWYTDASSASSAVLVADDVSGGVAAVAFSPAGDAVAAFVLGCHCLVVWRLQASWSQKLAALGSSRPLSQLPHAYISIPAAAALVSAVFARPGATPPAASSSSSSVIGAGGSEVLQWQLRWQMSSHIDLLYQGCLCGSVEVRL